MVPVKYQRVIFLEIDGLLIKTFSDWVEILKSVGSKLLMLKFETNYC